jgi:hypothetical protein
MKICPQENRLYIISIISIILTSFLYTIDVFLLNTAQFQFKSKAGNPIKKEFADASIALTVFSTLYMIYIVGVTYFEETWEISGLSSLINYEYIINGGLDVDSNYLSGFDRDVPCHKRKHRNSCTAGQNSRKCKWNQNKSKCYRTYSGGYSNFLIFLAISIYLIIFGVMIHNEQAASSTSDEFEHLATGSIIVGVIGVIFSVVDLFIC